MHVRTKRRLRLFIVSLGFAAASAASAGTLQQVLTSGKLRVGTTLAAPWAMRDDDGELRGFEIDVARKLAADMNVSVEFLRYDYEGLIKALESGEVDLIAAGFTITPARALHVNFSSPYATGGIGIATNLSRTADVTQLEQLDDPAHSVAALKKSVAADLARRVLPRAKLELYDMEADAAAALVSGKVDAYLDEEPLPHFLALEHPREVDVPVSEPLLKTPSAFAVAKGDPDFLAFLDAWIEARAADTWLPTTYEYWFRTLTWRK
jgi:polar amino acid transport system substrate-binding protein